MCQDGIVLIAIHIPDMEGGGSNCGPLRIEQLDHTTVLLTAGWRVDGMVLAEEGREICSKNAGIYGCLGNHQVIPEDRPTHMDTAIPTEMKMKIRKRRSLDYGMRLGSGLVDHLVQCHVKDNIRSLSTVGLLATTMSGPDNVPGELYLVDVTGLYPCQSIAIGSHSNQLNECLIRIEEMKEGGGDLSQKNVEEVKEILLGMLRDCSQGKRPYANDNDDDENNKTKRGFLKRAIGGKKKKPQYEEEASEEVWRIPDESIIEIVILKRNQDTFIREIEQFVASTSNP